MKLSLKHLLLISAVALAAHSPAVLAEDVAVASDAAEAAETVVADAAPDADAAAAEAEGEPADAGKECAADGSCAPDTEAAPEEDPKCPSRPHVIRCAAKYLDTNKNGALERSELEDAMGEVSWILRSLLKVIGSVDAIMKKCDADGDGKIDIETDMKATEETCLATCFKRKAFKQLFFPECTE